MTRSELPDNWQDLAAGYVLDNLSDEETVVWKTLLNDHPELADELEELNSSFNVLADTVSMHHPPDRLLSQIRATAQAELKPSISPTSSDPSLNSWVPRNSSTRLKQWTQWGGAIAATIMAVLGVQLYSLRSQLHQSRETIANLERQLQQVQTQAQTVSPVVHTLQQPGTLIYNLEGSSLANAASGRLILSHEQTVIIVVQNLPELTQGKVYRLWAALPTQSKLTYCGQFNNTPQGVVQLTPSSNHCSENPTLMVITIDAATDPITRGGPIVMQGRI